MKLITAIMRPYTLDKIVVALEEIENCPGIPVSEAEGFGQRWRTTSYAALNPFKEKKRIEIACNGRDSRTYCPGNSFTGAHARKIKATE